MLETVFSCDYLETFKAWTLSYVYQMLWPVLLAFSFFLFSSGMVLAYLVSPMCQHQRFQHPDGFHSEKTVKKEVIA